MNYYEFHLGDWARKCNHLSLLEEGAYRRLLDWYYTNERPLPVSVNEVCRAVRAKTPYERSAVKQILAEFFELAHDGWHQKKADENISRYISSLPTTLLQKQKVALRQARARLRRGAMFDALRKLDIVPKFNIGTDALARLCKESGADMEAINDDLRHASVTRDVTGMATEMTINQTPSRVTVRVTPVTLPLDPERIGAAMRAIKKTGFTSFNGSDPNFHALLRDGVTHEDLRIVAAEAAAKSKGWAWFLATVKGRREDAARAAAEGPPKTYKQRAAEASMREWVPELFETPQAPMKGQS